MANARSSSPWLSYAMARALAAAYPPLNPKDMLCAADELANETDSLTVISRLLRHGANLISARRIVEALRALRDLGS